MARLIATVAFAGYSPKLDVGQAIAELQAAGYGVRRMPDRYRARLDVPGGYFIEVKAVGPADHDSDDHKEIWAKLESIVAKYGGLADEFGAADTDRVPFAWFGDT
jgi:hypothetical protein